MAHQSITQTIVSRFSATNIVMKSGKFNDKETMDFTGHKSVQSLNIYCCVSAERKMELVHELTKVMNKTKDQIVQQEESEKQKEIEATPKKWPSCHHPGTN